VSAGYGGKDGGKMRASLCRAPVWEGSSTSTQAWRGPSREGDTMEGWGACMSGEEMPWGRNSQALYSKSHGAVDDLNKKGT